MNKASAQKNDGPSRSIFSEESAKTSTETNDGADNCDDGLTSEEQVIMMNIDYFEQWDRIAQKFDAQEKQVLDSMETHGIRML